MTKFINFQSPEKDILIDVLNGYPFLDSVNISSLIENIIYQKIEEYHDNGSLKCKYTVRFGERHGLYQEWWESGEGTSLGERGQLKEESNWTDGLKDGLYKRWCSGCGVSRKKEEESVWKMGEKEDLYQGLYREVNSVSYRFTDFKH
jgi:hypothetical protein